ncbi:MAG: hypothetical protein PWR10_1421 [Halanaerobiales bacterium]|nr:hypothetical protein [Halanaerobiales bacterium]
MNKIIRKYIGKRYQHNGRGNSSEEIIEQLIFIKKPRNRSQVPPTEVKCFYSL